MTKLKVYLKYFLYLLHLRTTIPAYFINKKCIRENGEGFVDLRSYPKLFFDASFDGKPVLIRAGVADKLHYAQSLLPKHLFLKVLSAYRSMKDQEKLYQFYYAEMQKNYPQLTAIDWERMTKAICANPKSGGGGHQTGGAVDITLCDECGKELDMGTRYLEMDTKTPTHASDISPVSQQNRALLCHVLNMADMQNYPNEWWHFCYGDRMWATYKRKKYAIYGVVRQAHLD